MNSSPCFNKSVCVALWLKLTTKASIDLVTSKGAMQLPLIMSGGSYELRMLPGKSAER